MKVNNRKSKRFRIKKSLKERCPGVFWYSPNSYIFKPRMFSRIKKKSRETEREKKKIIMRANNLEKQR